MAATKTSGLSALAGANIASGDLFSLVDVSDATMAASGTNKKTTANDLLTYVNLGEHPGYVSSVWYPGLTRTAVANHTLTVDRLEACLMRVFSQVTIRGLGFNVNTGAAGKNIKVGVFGFTAGVPDARMAVGSAAVSVASSSTFVSVDFTADLTLAPGIYAAALISDGSPSISANSASDYAIAPYLGASTGQNAIVAGSFVTGWYTDAGNYTAGIPTSFGASTRASTNFPTPAFQVR